MINGKNYYFCKILKKALLYRDNVIEYKKVTGLKSGINYSEEFILKKILAMLMAILMFGTVAAGCGGNDATENNSTDGSTSEVGGADESWTKVESAGKLVMGLDDSFPPMGYKDPETGEIVGFDVDLAKEVCSRLGIELVLQPIVWETKETELNGGNIDCIWNGFTSTPEREEAMLLSDPYMKNTQVVMVAEGSEFTDLASLAGKTVAVQSGSSGDNALNADENADFKNSLGNIIKIQDYLSAITELENGTVDGIVLDEKVATNYINMKPGKYRILEADGKEITLSEEEYVIAFRKGDQALMEKIMETLKEMKEDGKLAEISTKWFEEDVTTI